MPDVDDFTIPDTTAGFEEFLADDKKLKALTDKPGEFGRFIAAYKDKFMAANGETLSRQAEEAAQRVLRNFLKDHGAELKAPVVLDPLTKGVGNRQARRAAARNPQAMGAQGDGIFSTFGEFAHAVYGRTNGNGQPTPDQLAKLERLNNAYTERIPGDGGFLVPEEFRSELFMLALETAIVRPRAQVVPMSGPTLSYPKVDSTSNVSSVFGGIVVYRTEEGATLTASQAQFSRIKLEATKQTALARVTNELLNDVALQAFLQDNYPAAMAYAEDVDFIGGTGVGAPLGGLSTGNGALIVVSGETTQTTATIVWLNVLKMYARMLPTSLARAVWMATPEAFVELATMALEVGTGGSAVWLTDARGEPQLTLLGRPVIMTEKAPAVLGTQGDLSLVDWGMYLIGDRQTVTLTASEHVNFESDQTTFRLIARNDGQPWMDSALTPHNNGPTLSPFVQLATR